MSYGMMNDHDGGHYELTGFEPTDPIARFEPREGSACPYCGKMLLSRFDLSQYLTMKVCRRAPPTKKG